MDKPTVITPTSLLLWILLAFLLVWLFTFAILALKREARSTVHESPKAVLPRSARTSSAHQQLQKFAAVPAKAAALPSLTAKASQEDIVLERSLG